MSIVVGNAPVSWGVYEAHLPNPPYARVLDAIAEAGYAGTELGPYGYLPVQQDVLARALQQRGLRLGSSFVAVALEDPSRRAAAIAHCLQVGELLASQGEKHVIVADDEDPLRARHAGRIPSDGGMSWSDAQWREVATTLGEIGWALKKRLGMSVVVHHHAGTFIETRGEIDRLMVQTDAGLVDLLIDTGHATYGGADPVDVLRRWGPRVRYVHFKDVKPEHLARVRSTAVTMGDAWKGGVFSTIGEGVVDFRAFTKLLRDGGYAGWVIVEQDVVPDAAGRLVPDPLASAQQSRAFLRKELGL
jgi:inosose dehydratase